MANANSESTVINPNRNNNNRNNNNRNNNNRVNQANQANQANPWMHGQSRPQTNPNPNQPRSSNSNAVLYDDIHDEDEVKSGNDEQKDGEDGEDREEKDQLDTVVSDIEGYMNAYIQMVSDLNTHVETINKKLNDLQKQIYKLEDAEADVQSKIDSLKEELKKCEEEKIKLRDELARCNGELNNKKIELKNLQDVLEKLRSDIIEANVTDQDIIDEMRKKIKEKEDKEEELKREITDLEQKNRTLLDRLEKIRNSFHVTNQAFGKRSGELKQIIRDIETFQRQIQQITDRTLGQPLGYNSGQSLENLVSNNNNNPVQNNNNSVQNNTSSVQNNTSSVQNNNNSVQNNTSSVQNNTSSVRSGYGGGAKKQLYKMFGSGKKYSLRWRYISHRTMFGGYNRKSLERIASKWGIVNTKSYKRRDLLQKTMHFVMFARYGDIKLRKNLNTAAKILGLNPKNYKRKQDLYSAVYNKTNKMNFNLKGGKKTVRKTKKTVRKTKKTVRKTKKTVRKTKKN